MSFNSNCCFWKIKIVHILTLKDIVNFLVEGTRPTTEALSDWTTIDKKDQAVTSLSLSNELLENVIDVDFTKEMWTKINKVFERHS